MRRAILTFFVMSMVIAASAQELQVLGGNAGVLGANFVAPTIDGKDNVYGPLTGEIIYDASDATFYGRTQSNTWSPLGGASNVTPTGTVITFAAAACPTGYLATDGSTVSRTTYASLFDVIGTTHGQGDGSTTFNLPDYRGRFLRGVDGSAGRDPNDSTRTAMNTGGNTGDNVGSVQADAFQGHYHGMPTSYAPASSTSGGVGGTMTSQNNGLNGGTLGPVSDGSNGTPRTSSETRPINAYVNFCIKY